MLPEPEANAPQITRPLYLTPEARVPPADRLRNAQQSALQTNQHATPLDTSSEYRRDLPSSSPWNGGQRPGDVMRSSSSGTNGTLRPPRGNTTTKGIDRWLRSFSMSGLRWQLTCVYTALFILFVFILSGVIYSSVASLLYKDGRASLSAQVLRFNGIRSQLVNAIYCQGETLPTAVSAVAMANQSNDIDLISILNTTDQVLASSDTTLVQQGFPYIDTPSLRFSVGKTIDSTTLNGAPIAVFLTTLQFPRTSGGCLRPQGLNTGPHYLAVTTSYRAENATLNGVVTTIVIAALAIIIIGAVIVFVLTNFLLLPLRRMKDTAQAIALGDLKQRVRLPQGADEVGALAASFNEMIDQIEGAFEMQRASEQRVRRFVSDASHELRTPLTSLRGFTDVLIRGAKDDPEALRRSLKLMKNETERMSRLVNDLLTLARLDEGRPLQIQHVDLVDMATEAVEQAKILAVDGRSITLHLATQERLETLADVDRLKQVLLILFDNAMKYGRPGPEGWIALRVEKQRDAVLMHMIDNGKGIAPEDLAHVFERFYRGQQGTDAINRVPTAPVVGAGLGLSIAIAIVHAHQGDITAWSEAGKGITFTVTLPLSL